MRRATLSGALSATGTGRFNSRPRAEGDREISVTHELIKVSIHALARRATWWAVRKASRALMFQFTPSRGGRPQCGLLRSGDLCFNSRPRAEGDDLPAPDAYDGMFQFTPSRGGRRTVSAVRSCRCMFQFTPSRGGRLAGRFAAPRLMMFQFTPSRGGRLTLRRWVS